MSTLHEISFIKATVSVFIIPLIIVGSVTAYVTRLSLDYVKDILTSHMMPISIKSASCVNRRIVIDLVNEIDKTLDSDRIKLFIDGVDESQYFHFENIKPGESRSTMSIKLEKYPPGKHKVEVEYNKKNG